MKKYKYVSFTASWDEEGGTLDQLLNTYGEAGWHVVLMQAQGDAIRIVMEREMD